MFYTLSFMQMKDVPGNWLPRLRELTFGRENDSPMYRWTYHEGRCWIAVLSQRLQTQQSELSPFPHATPEPKILAWACLTYEEDRLPVVGVYVDRSQRKRGLGRAVSEYLLQRAELPVGSAVYAVSENWASWPKVLASFGLEHFEWE